MNVGVEAIATLSPSRTLQLINVRFTLHRLQQFLTPKASSVSCATTVPFSEVRTLYKHFGSVLLLPWRLGVK
jgi:hypothetical protein